ncbi:MAG: hypothetical protein HYZ75_11765 [Elusimicrobia bacterium]|nr:hypothetical protein [Elusimicrobiota bacterium]
MRKNLTVSLSDEDWKIVRDIAERLGETYSAVFHRLIEMSGGTVSDLRRVSKYKALLAPHAVRLEKRAAAFARAGRRGKTAA